jgi:hypothetical protein
MIGVDRKGGGRTFPGRSAQSRYSAIKNNQLLKDIE